MKRSLFSAILLVIVSALLAQPANTSKVPKELIGHWQLGTFSMTNFRNPTTGQYAGNAGEASRSYQIAADGTAEEFFIYNSTSYNCRTQILGYRKGTLKFSADGKSFTFCPTMGYYRSANCFKKDWAKKEYGTKDLYPAYQFTVYWSVENGALVLKETPQSASTIYRKIDTASK
ncbi:MAG TPA: hypothetical protein VER36_00370 [Flavisolibacter sp.]|nr:hypothetical protein [Flavisolibacter sp.]